MTLLVSAQAFYGGAPGGYGPGSNPLMMAALLGNDDTSSSNLLPLLLMGKGGLGGAHPGGYDSKIKEPEIIGGKLECYQFLENHLKDKDKELFLIVSKEVQETEMWKVTQKSSNGLYVELP